MRVKLFTHTDLDGIGYSVYSELFDRITNLYDSFEDAE